MTGLVYRFARWCPGAVGLWLRQKIFPRCFMACGRKVLFGRFLEFVAPEKIALGDKVVLNNGVVLDAGKAQAGTAIILEDNVFVGTNTIMRAEGKGVVTIRAGANFSSYCLVTARSFLEVGSNCLVAAYCELGCRPAAVEIPDRNDEGHRSVVGGGCWLGVRMRIVEGVSVGHDTIVGAHALVTGDLPPYIVAVGDPATELRKR